MIKFIYTVNSFQSIMADPVLVLDYSEKDYVNEALFGQILKLVPVMEGTRLGFDEVLNGLVNAGVQLDQIGGINKVSPTEPSYNVFCKTEDVFDMLLNKKILKIGRHKVHVCTLAEQIVSLRVHWLPFYIDNLMLKEIFSEYGEIVQLTFCSTPFREHGVGNGVRLIALRTHEMKKQEIPHLIKFKSGLNILVTMGGRPPFCLRCKSTGHIRGECPGLQKNVNGVKPVKKVTADPTPVRTPKTPNVQSAKTLVSADMAVTPNKEKGVSGKVAPKGEQPPQSSLLSMPVLETMDVEIEKTPKRGSDSVGSSPRFPTGKVARPGPDPRLNQSPAPE